MSIFSGVCSGVVVFVVFSVFSGFSVCCVSLSFLPKLITSPTSVPSGTSSPVSFVCVITTPSSTVSLSVVVISPTFNLEDFNAFSALDCVNPSTLGTIVVLVSSPLETTILTVVSAVIFVPETGFCSITVSISASSSYS